MWQQDTGPEEGKGFTVPKDEIDRAFNCNEFISECICADACIGSSEQQKSDVSDRFVGDIPLTIVSGGVGSMANIVADHIARKSSDSSRDFVIFGDLLSRLAPDALSDFLKSKIK